MITVSYASSLNPTEHCQRTIGVERKELKTCLEDSIFEYLTIFSQNSVVISVTFNTITHQHRHTSISATALKTRSQYVGFYDNYTPSISIMSCLGLSVANQNTIQFTMSPSGRSSL